MTTTAVRGLASVESRHYDNLTVRSRLLGDYGFDRADPLGGLVVDALTATPLGRRAIGARTLSVFRAAHDIIPGASDVTTHGHISDMSYAAIELGRGQGQLSDDFIAHVMYRKLWDDTAKGPGAHESDKAVQGHTGQENWHEGRFFAAAKIGGMYSALAHHGGARDWAAYAFDAKVPGWLTCSRPDVSLDRWQFVADELLAWRWEESMAGEQAGAIREAVRKASALDQLLINSDGDLVFKTIEAARMHGKGTMLAGVADWGSMANRVRSRLMVDLLRAGTTHGQFLTTVPGDIGQYHPYDYLWATDNQVAERIAADTDGNYYNGRPAEEHLHVTHGTLAALGAEERAVFRRMAPDYAVFLLDDTASELPVALVRDPSTVYAEGVHPPDSRGTYLGDLQPSPPKFRAVDPLVHVEGLGDVRLSSVDGVYKQLMVQYESVGCDPVAVHLRNDPARVLAYHWAYAQGRHFDSACEAKPAMSRDQALHALQYAADVAVHQAIGDGRWQPNSSGLLIDHTRAVGTA